jgi:hypothetical protein
MSNKSKLFWKTCINKYIKRKTRTFGTKPSHQWHQIDAAAGNEFSQRNTLACILSEVFITFLFKIRRTLYQKTAQNLSFFDVQFRVLAVVKKTTSLPKSGEI